MYFEMHEQERRHALSALKATKAQAESVEKAMESIALDTTGPLLLTTNIETLVSEVFLAMDRERDSEGVLQPGTVVGLDLHGEWLGVLRTSLLYYMSKLRAVVKSQAKLEVEGVDTLAVIEAVSALYDRCVGQQRLAA